MPDDILTSRERRFVESYWSKYDSAMLDSDLETASLLRQLIEKTYLAAAYKLIAKELEDFHAEQIRITEGADGPTQSRRSRRSGHRPDR